MAKKLPQKDDNVPAPVGLYDDCPQLDIVSDIKLTDDEEYNIRLIEGMSSHMLAPDEICAVIGMSRAAFEKHLVYQAAYQRGQGIGKASLRRWQWKKAPRDTTMLIWLGKQHLGQADKIEQKSGDEHENAIKGFFNKLEITLNVPNAGHAPRVVDPGGTGSGEVPMAHLGEREPTGAESGIVVEAEYNPGAPEKLASGSEKRGEDLQGQLADLVVSSRQRKRKNTKRSGMDSPQGRA